jgi:heme-degrading monooxygenase HmoA
VGFVLQPTWEIVMIARIWHGWTSADSAEEVAAHLRDVTVARYEAIPGNVSAYMLRRPSAGGVELMTLSLWESTDALPPGVDETHRMLVARQTIPSCWEVVGTREVVAEAA